MIGQEQRRDEMENWVDYKISLVLPSMKDEKMCWRSKSKHCSLAKNSLVSRSRQIQDMRAVYCHKLHRTSEIA